MLLSEESSIRKVSIGVEQHQQVGLPFVRRRISRMTTGRNSYVGPNNERLGASGWQGKCHEKLPKARLHVLIIDQRNNQLSAHCSVVKGDRPVEGADELQAWCCQQVVSMGVRLNKNILKN
jgi:hypothetical protein